MLDLVFTLRLASVETDYVLVLEDDTPVVGHLPSAVLQCHDIYGPGKATACRWDFLWQQAEAVAKVVPLTSQSANSSPKVSCLSALCARGNDECSMTAS